MRPRPTPWSPTSSTASSACPRPGRLLPPDGRPPRRSVPVWEARLMAPAVSGPSATDWPSPAAAALVAATARTFETRFDEVTDELMARLGEEMPELIRDEDLREQTYATARASAQLIT